MTQGRGFNRGKMEAQQLVIDRETWRRLFAGMIFPTIIGDVNRDTRIPPEIAAKYAIDYANILLNELEK